jgi:uncharacterized protein YeaO (DUF488 family)
VARPTIRVKRIYEPAAESDGHRILVDRLWPRGVSKAAARIDLWLRDIGPSTVLRHWFNHDPARWKEFCVRYRAELREQQALLDVIRERAKEGPVTLLYSARDEDCNQAVVLQLVLKQSTGRKRATT